MDHQNGAMYPGPGAPHTQSPARPSFFPSGASSPVTPNPNSGSFAPSPTPLSFADAHARYQNPYLQAAAGGAPAQSPFNGAGGFPVPSGAANGNMMPSQADGSGAFVQPQPRQLLQNQYNTSGPQHQGLSTPTAPAAQKFANVTKGALPSHVSPYSNSVPQPPRSEASQAQPMAAPVNSSHNQEPGTQTPIKSTSLPPTSPGATAREKDRISLLLEINTLLLQEIMTLQSQGKAGAGAQPPQDGRPAVPAQQASKEYIEVIRRLQANLHYLAAHAERSGKQPNHVVPQGPAIMVAPTTPPTVAEMYTRLQSLFPGWRGGAPMKASPGPNRPGGNPAQGAPQQGSPQAVGQAGQAGPAPQAGQPS